MRAGSGERRTGSGVDRHGSVYVGEVIVGGSGAEGVGAAGRVPLTCHALQVFHRA